MNIITKKVTLLPAPFVGTRIKIRVPSTDEGDLEYRIFAAVRADDTESFDVDWGDGSTETKSGIVSRGHIYAAPGDYEIKISDGIKSLACSSSGGSAPFLSKYGPSVLSLVSNATKLARLGCMYGCRNMRTFDIRKSAVSELGEKIFVDCASLSGDIYLPRISELPYTDTQPFAGCTGGITRIHFSAEHESAIRNSAAFLADATLGTGVADVCKFDL